jgi:lipopolysaccharide transport system ATP-binding protein
MIDVRDLSKAFKLYRKPSDRLKEIILRKPYHTTHKALTDITFRVDDGETLGILGRNGAGKSTLLKILNGVTLQDHGHVIASGRITGLLELGTGFDPNLTGRQNIYANGLLIGMKEHEIRSREADIIAFSELGDFIEEPVRTYSSGMTVRLAFSIAIHSNPDIFLIDEALSVGDGHFQQKCMRAIREFKANGGSIIFVSHDLNAVKMICDRAIVLSGGRIVTDDEPESAVNCYNQLLGMDDEPTLVQSDRGYGSKEIEIIDTRLSSEHSGQQHITSGDEVTLQVMTRSHTTLRNVTLGMMIRDRMGQDLYGTNSYYLGCPIQTLENQNDSFEFRFPMNLAPGKYTITLALHEGSDHTRHCYHWWDNALRFEVSGIKGPVFGGLFNLNPSFSQLKNP